MAQEETQILDNQAISPILNHSSISVNNTYSYANNTLFYAFVNPTYFSYYFRLVRRTIEWLDGYVIDFHDSDNGVFSTRLNACIMSGLAKQIIGKEITFKSSNKKDDIAVKKAQEFAKKSRLRDNFVTLATWCLNTGTALLKLNRTRGGEYWVEPIRLDYCVYNTDFRNRVTEATILVKRYQNISNKDNQNNFFLVENRYFKEVEEKFEKKVGNDIVEYTSVVEKPFVKYQVHRYTGQVLTAELMASDINSEKGIEWENLPDSIKKSIKRDYNTIKVNEEQVLPFNDDLGVYVFLNEGQDITLPSALFGNSLCSRILSELMAYDLAFSWYLRDMYNGKGQVVTPKSWNAGNIDEASRSLSGLDQNGTIQAIPGLDPEKDRPFNYQFDIRGVEWQNVQDNLLRKIATKIGISPRVLSSYLDNSANQRTATEINEESDTASEWIETHRADYEDTLNEIINKVLRLQGITDEVSVKFATPSLVNKDRIIQRVIALRDNGFIDDEVALKEIYPDYTDEQITDYLERAKKQRDEEMAKQMTPTDLSQFE